MTPLSAVNMPPQLVAEKTKTNEQRRSKDVWVDETRL